MVNWEETFKEWSAPSSNIESEKSSNEASFNEATETGGIAPLNTIPNFVIKALQENKDFMENFDFHSTPIIIFKESSGKVNILKGTPIREMLGIMLGLSLPTPLTFMDAMTGHE